MPPPLKDGFGGLSSLKRCVLSKLSFLSKIIRNTSIAIQTIYEGGYTPLGFQRPAKVSYQSKTRGRGTVCLFHQRLADLRIS